MPVGARDAEAERDAARLREYAALRALLAPIGRIAPAGSPPPPSGAFVIAPSAASQLQSIRAPAVA